MTGLQLILEERCEQITKHKFHPSHDDQHTDGMLTKEAARLAVLGTDANVVDPSCDFPDPWGLQRKLAGHRIHQLKVAGALIAAEIDRLLRAGVKDD